MSWLVVKRSDISKYISLVTPWHSRWLHFLSSNPVILWNDQELHQTSTSSGLWWHKKEPFIAWKTFDHKVLPQIPSTHGVFNFPCQRISGRHHVRDWSSWITTFSLDSQTLQRIRPWNASLSNHANASLLPWHREKSYIKDRTNCQTKQQATKWILAQSGAINKSKTIRSQFSFNRLVSSHVLHQSRPKTIRHI